MSKLEAGVDYGFVTGSPGLRSIGSIAFGPDGILVAADNADARIVALRIDDDQREAGPIEVENLDARLAAYLGCAREDVAIRDLAVHPESQAVYLSVMRGAGSSALALVIRVGSQGALSDVPLVDIPFAQTAIVDAPTEDDERLDARVVAPGEKDGTEMEVRGITLRVARDTLRTNTITDIAYVDGTLLVAGASNEEFVSTLRRIPFPFDGDAQRSTLEIFHVSHGKYETHSPIRSFVPYEGGASILASYTCTPVVHFPLSELTDGGRAVGRTVAELGAMNTPVDMVSYTRDGDEFLLVSNTRHPLFKIACADIDAAEGLATPTEPLGVPRVELPHEGVGRMAVVDGRVLMLQREGAELNLRSYDTSSL